MVADQRAANREEGFVDVVPAVVASLKASVLVQPGDRVLDHPAIFAKPRAVGRVAFGDSRCDAALAERLAVLAAVVGAVGEQDLRSELAVAAGGGTRSTSPISSVMSLRFAAVKVAASGVP